VSCTLFAANRVWGPQRRGWRGHSGGRGARRSVAPRERGTAVVDRRVRRAYEVRFSSAFQPFSPEVPSLPGVVDLPAHGHTGQQDPLAVAHLASRAGMAGILWKTLGDPRVPWLAHRDLVHALARWAEREHVAPTACAFGAMTEPAFGSPILERVREAV